MNKNARSKSHKTMLFEQYVSRIDDEDMTEEQMEELLITWINACEVRGLQTGGVVRFEEDEG